jgi:hypothetical protein
MGKIQGNDTPSATSREVAFPNQKNLWANCCEWNSQPGADREKTEKIASLLTSPRQSSLLVGQDSPPGIEQISLLLHLIPVFFWMYWHLGRSSLAVSEFILE